MDARRAGVARITRKRVGLASQRWRGGRAPLLGFLFKSVRLRRTRVQSGDRNGCERHVSLRRAAPRLPAPRLRRGYAGRRREMEEAPRTLASGGAGPRRRTGLCAQLRIGVSIAAGS